MAIRKRKDAFQVYWNNPHTGKRESITCKTLEDAQKEDSLIKHRLRFERESFSKGEEKEVQEVTLEALYMAYLKDKQFSLHNLSRHFSAMRYFLKQIGQMPINEITSDLLKEIRERTIQDTHKEATAHKRLSLLRTLIRWAAEKGLMAMPLFPKLPSAHYEHLVPPTSQELAAMLHAAPEHLKRVIIIGSQCGVRVGPCELFSLTWEDIDIEARVIRVHAAKKNPNAPWREIPIRSSLLPAFEQWKKEDENIGATFIIHVKGKPVSSIKRAWNTALKNAGINRRIRPYDLRHAFATELIAAGVDVGTIAKLMGHSSPTMIFRHYQFVMDRQKRQAVESLPDVLHVPGSMCQIEKGATVFQ